MDDDRQLRNLVEQLQTDLARARAEGEDGRLEVERLTRELEAQQAQSKQALVELNEARKAFGFLSRHFGDRFWLSFTPRRR